MPFLSDYDLVIIYVGVISYLGAILQGLLSFGDSIVIHLLWRVAVIAAPEVMKSTPFGEKYLLSITLILAVRAVVILGVFCAQSMHIACKPLLKIVIPIQVAFIVAGSWMLDRFRGTTWIAPMLGLSFALAAFAFGGLSVRRLFANRALGKRAVAAEKKAFVITPRVQIVMGFAAIATGIVAGLCSVGGPPMMIAGIAMNVPQQVLRGTNPFASFVSYLVRDLMSLYTGDLHIADAWMLYLAASLGAVAGLQVGMELSGNVSHDEFIVAVCWLLLFAGISLARLSGWVIAFAVPLCAFTMYHVRKAAQADAAAGIYDGRPSPTVTPSSTPCGSPLSPGGSPAFVFPSAPLPPPTASPGATPMASAEASIEAPPPASTIGGSWLSTAPPNASVTAVMRRSWLQLSFLENRSIIVPQQQQQQQQSER